MSLYLTRLRGIVPLLRGDDLLALGLEPGPLFSRIIERLLRARLDGEVKSRYEEEEMVRSLVLELKTITTVKPVCYKNPS